jgi:hypothetical protein
MILEKMVSFSTLNKKKRTKMEKKTEDFPSDRLSLLFDRAIVSSELNLTITEGPVPISFSQNEKGKCSKMMEQICDRLTQNPEIQKVELSGYPIQEEDIQLLAKNSTLTSLSMNYSQLGDKDAIALSQNKTLTELNISFNRITDKGLRILSSNQSLKSLKISAELCACELFEALSQISTLTSLELTGGYIEEGGLFLLTSNPSLTSLHVYSSLTKSHITEMAQNANLTEINLNCAGLDDKDVEGLMENPSLKILHIDDNRNIKTKGIKALAGSSSLTRLRCSNNNFDDKDIITLAQSKTLKELFLFDNRFGEEGLSALAEKQTIEALAFSKIKLTHKTVTKLASSLRALYAPGCDFDEEDAIILAKSLQLAELVIYDNKIGDIGALALARNQNLLLLNVSRNRICKKGIQALTENSTLTYLETAFNPGSNEASDAVKAMFDRKVNLVKDFRQLDRLLSPSLSAIFPSVLERLVLDYCKPSPFIFPIPSTLSPLPRLRGPVFE